MDMRVDIQEQFNKIAREYDVNRRKFIPCFDEFYLKTTAFITSNINAPNRVIDLGAGTGLLTSYWYQHFPSAEYILVDIADDMLDIARKRFDHIETISSDDIHHGHAKALFVIYRNGLLHRNYISLPILICLLLRPYTFFTEHHILQVYLKPEYGQIQHMGHKEK